VKGKAILIYAHIFYQDCSTKNGFKDSSAQNCDKKSHTSRKAIVLLFCKENVANLEKIIDSRFIQSSDSSKW